MGRCRVAGDAHERGARGRAGWRRAGRKASRTAVGGGEIPFREQDSYKSNIGVKLQLVKFGRN